MTYRQQLKGKVLGMCARERLQSLITLSNLLLIEPKRRRSAKNRIYLKKQNDVVLIPSLTNLIKLSVTRAFSFRKTLYAEISFKKVK